MWEYYNCNPLKREVNDCVVRAISLAEGKSWDETYQILSEIAQKNAIILDDTLFVEKYLNSKYEAIFEPYLPTLVVSIIWVTISMFVGGTVTCFLRNIPIIKEII